MIRQFWLFFLNLSFSGLDLSEPWRPWHDLEKTSNLAFEDNKFIATAFKIYSLESPIYTQMNKSSADMDEVGLQLLSPFAWYFSFQCQTQQLRKV